MATLKVTQSQIIGPHGTLPLKANDHAARKLVLLVLAECLGEHVSDAATACGYTRARYYQVRQDYLRGGTDALRKRKPGRTRNTVLTPNVEREIVRHVVLDSDATARVVAQRMNQQGTEVSRRSVERTITKFGLQKNRYTPIRATNPKSRFLSTSARP
jgi:transposase